MWSTCVCCCYAPILPQYVFVVRVCRFSEFNLAFASLSLCSPAQSTHNLRPTKHILFILNWFNFCVTLSVAVLASNHPPMCSTTPHTITACCCPPSSTFHLSGSAYSLEIGKDTHTLIFYFWSRVRMKYKFSWMFNWLFMRWFRTQDENLSWW